MKMPSIYVVRPGEHIKIGITTDIVQRMMSFRNAVAEPEFLAPFNGEELTGAAKEWLAAV